MLLITLFGPHCRSFLFDLECDLNCWLNAVLSAPCRWALVFLSVSKIYRSFRIQCFFYAQDGSIRRWGNFKTRIWLRKVQRVTFGAPLNFLSKWVQKCGCFFQFWICFLFLNGLVMSDVVVFGPCTYRETSCVYTILHARHLAVLCS